MQNKANQGRKVVSPVTILNRVAKWEFFVVNRVGGYWPLRHISTQTFLECLPPPSRPIFLTSHADVRSIRSSSRVLQMKVILLTIRQEIYSNMAKTPAVEGIWMQSSVTNICLVTFLLCECARWKCVHWKIQPLGWIWGIGLLKFGSEAWGIRQKKCIIHCWASRRFLFFLFPQASQLSMNFNISELVYLLNYFLKTHK